MPLLLPLLHNGWLYTVLHLPHITTTIAAELAVARVSGWVVRSFVGCTIYLVGIIRWVQGEKYTLDWVLLLVVNVVPFGKSAMVG